MKSIYIFMLLWVTVLVINETSVGTFGSLATNSAICFVVLIANLLCGALLAFACQSKDSIIESQKLTIETLERQIHKND